MSVEEARAWLRDERSMVNFIPSTDVGIWYVQVAQADAAMIQQAYYVLKAHKERITER